MKQFVSMTSVVAKVHKVVRSNFDELNKIDFVVGMSRGGLIPAAMLATAMDKPLITIYIDKKDNIYLDRTDWMKDKNILFVDDICRSGLTIKLATDVIKTQPIKSLKTMTLFNVTSVKNKQVTPDYTNNIKNDVILPWDWDRMQFQTH